MIRGFFEGHIETLPLPLVFLVTLGEHSSKPIAPAVAL